MQAFSSLTIAGPVGSRGVLNTLMSRYTTMDERKRAESTAQALFGSAVAATDLMIIDL